MIAGQVLAAWSIGHLELSIVEPLLTTNLLFALILAVPLSHQALRVTEVAGALLLIAGEGLLELARSAQPIGQSFGSFSHWPLAAIIAVIAGVLSWPGGTGPAGTGLRSPVSARAWSSASRTR